MRGKERPHKEQLLAAIKHLTRERDSYWFQTEWEWSEREKTFLSLLSLKLTTGLFLSSPLLYPHRLLVLLPLSITLRETGSQQTRCNIHSRLFGEREGREKTTKAVKIGNQSNQRSEGRRKEKLFSMIIMIFKPIVKYLCSMIFLFENERKQLSLRLFQIFSPLSLISLPSFPTSFLSPFHLLSIFYDWAACDHHTFNSFQNLFYR